MIDTHCHIDQYNEPEVVARAAESQAITTVAVTNLPSHYNIAVQQLSGFKCVFPALGLHPLAVQDHDRELPDFLSLVEEASYVGEIGLDFSGTNARTREAQVASFRAILARLGTSPRFITVHSRGAENAVLECLIGAAVGPVCFHWFSGTASTLRRVLEAGHYLSLNPAMTTSKRWTTLLELIPRDRILTETDGPFTRCGEEPSRPTDVRTVLEWIAKCWRCTWQDVDCVVAGNFDRIREGG